MENRGGCRKASTQAAPERKINMDLVEAIRITQNEYDREVVAFDSNPDYKSKCIAAIELEFDAIVRSGLISAISESARAYSDPAMNIAIAFRMGMRVQRKLHDPSAATTIIPRPVQ